MPTVKDATYSIPWEGLQEQKYQPNKRADQMETGSGTQNIQAAGLAPPTPAEWP